MELILYKINVQTLHLYMNKVLGCVGEGIADQLHLIVINEYSC